MLTIDRGSNANQARAESKRKEETNTEELVKITKGSTHATRRGKPLHKWQLFLEVITSATSAEEAEHIAQRVCKWIERRYGDFETCHVLAGRTAPIDPKTLT